MLYRQHGCVHAEVMVRNEEEQRRRRRRSVALAVILAAFGLLFYLVTIFKLGPDVLNRPL